MPVHPGEVTVQGRAGSIRTDLGSARTRAEIPPVAAEFLGRQHMLIVGVPDDEGAVWADVITGPAGFGSGAGTGAETGAGAGTADETAVPTPLAEVVDDRTIAVHGAPSLVGPLLDGVRDVGLLGIEPWTRRRMRINGTVRRDRRAQRLVVRTEQVFANCPKYIQERRLLGPASTPSPAPTPAESTGDGTSDARAVRTAQEISPVQRDRIARSDTFFVASHVPGHGADVSHRGGDPGVLTTVGSRRLWWPDYVGNSMYMTLGNLELNPSCGLLILDWETGSTLHLTGRARVDWDERRAAAVPGAQRIVDFDVDQVVEVTGGFPLRWRFMGPSPFNPS